MKTLLLLLACLVFPHSASRAQDNPQERLYDANIGFCESRISSYKVYTSEHGQISGRFTRIKIENNGNMALYLRGVHFPSNSAFSPDSGSRQWNFPFVLHPSESRMLPVSFDPDRPGVHRDTINFLMTCEIGFALGDTSVILQDTAFTVSSAEDEGEDGISIGPNPVSELLRIESPGGRYFRAELYSAPGERILSQALNPGLTLIPVKDIPAGLYFLRLREADSAIIIKKLVIAR